MNVHSSIYGLVLAGGASRRMHTDKAALIHDGKTQLQHAYELLNKLCERTFISVRDTQTQDAIRASLPQIVDVHNGIGPLAGISAAQKQHPNVAWLVMACDLPFVTEDTLQYLIRHRDTTKLATAFRSTYDGLPEPLCSIWEPVSASRVEEWIASSNKCPRKLLINSTIQLLDSPNQHALDNINTPEEHLQALSTLGSPSISLNVQYFALFREQAGKRSEQLNTVASSPALLYTELQQRYGFKLTMNQLKVAINNEFSDWQTTLKSGDHVAFIPPVAGG